MRLTCHSQAHIRRPKNADDQKRFTDELDSLLYPSPKRSRIYTTRPSPVSYYTSCTPLPPLPSLRTYTPFSPLALLARLRTFDPFSYSSSIPSPLTARQVALAGWTAGPGNNCVHCALCGGGWDLSGVSEILDEATRKEVASRLEGAKITKHRKGCAWKITQSPDELYGQMRRMLHPPTVGSLGPLQAALRGQCEDLGRIRWTAPIVRLDRFIPAGVFCLFQASGLMSRIIVQHRR